MESFRKYTVLPGEGRGQTIAQVDERIFIFHHELKLEGLFFKVFKTHFKSKITKTIFWSIGSDIILKDIHAYVCVSLNKSSTCISCFL